MITQQEFAARRRQLMQKIGKGSLAIVAAAPLAVRNGDIHYSYRQNSDFYYLTGFPEPDAIAVLIPGSSSNEDKYILFNRPSNAVAEQWEGKRAGQKSACQQYGASESFPIDDFPRKLPELLDATQKICYALGQQAALDHIIMATVNQLRHKKRAGVVAPLELVDLEYSLHEMRLIKSAAEIQVMRKAAQISAEAHCRAMQKCKPGLYEYQLEAELLYEFHRQGGRALAYGSIVGGGANGCILHYTENNSRLTNGDLVLIDAGCEYDYYASDITRTFPVKGRFSPEQRAIYEIVLKAQLAVIDAIRPGVRWDHLHEVSVQIIIEGLQQLGILQGDVTQLRQANAHLPFYMHRVTHWLGMDVHDVGRYKVNEEWRLLERGMALTVEPGIYIAADNPSVDKKWWGLAVRIEDDVVVTENGCEVLSAGVPKTIAAIEALMHKKDSVA